MAHDAPSELTPWLAFCADILPLHATPEEARRFARPASPPEDFAALLALEEQGALPASTMAEDRAPVRSVVPEPVAIAPEEQSRPSRAATAKAPPVPSLGRWDGVDGATARRMKRGQLTPDAVLDLHGYALIDAFTALVRTVQSGRHRGVRLLLVITGKGRARGLGGVDGDGKLRRALPHWLADAALHPHVVTASAAAKGHGGGGAFYLLLRKPDARA